MSLVCAQEKYYFFRVIEIVCAALFLCVYMYIIHTVYDVLIFVRWIDTILQNQYEYELVIVFESQKKICCRYPTIGKNTIVRRLSENANRRPYPMIRFRDQTHIEHDQDRSDNQ